MGCEAAGLPGSSIAQVHYCDVLVPRLAWRAGVDLRTDDAGSLDVRILFDVVHGLDTVEPELDVLSLGADHVVVPVAVFDQTFHLGLIRTDQHFVPAGFVVQRAPPADSDIGLVPRDFVVVGYAFRSELDSGVGRIAAEELY